MSKQAKSQPMDPSAREGASPAYQKRNPRNAYALDTLVEEVRAAFGEVPVLYDGIDAWDVSHQVGFEADNDTLFTDVVRDVLADSRVLKVDHDLGHLWVTFHYNRRTRDLRDGFGIAAIKEVWEEDEPEVGPYNGDLSLHLMTRKVPQA